MDNPPPNYNPNESMLSGGIDVPIMKVMGGGGGTPPEGYNENTSLLTGGIDQPIIKVEGGMRSDFKGTPGEVRATIMKEEADEERDHERLRRIMNKRRGAITSQSKNIVNAADTLQGIRERGTSIERSSSQDDLENLMARKADKYATNIETNIETNAAIGKLFQDEIKQINNIRYIKNFNNKDQNLYEAFVNSSSKNIDAAISKLERIVKRKEDADKKLHYVKEQNRVEINAVTNLDNYTQIKFIPTNTIEIIVLPPTKTADDFFNCILFLVQNKYLTITYDKEFKLKKKIFVVHLSIDESVQLIKYFYLKLKISNENYYLANKEYNIIYPNELDGTKGLLFLDSDKNLPTPLNANEVEPTDFDTIREYSIKKMVYKTHGGKAYDNNFSLIKGGNTDENPTDNYNITLNKNIAIIELIDEDIKTIDVDMNGKHYRIRVPHLKGSNDKIYLQWLKGKYKKDENQLLKDLYIEKVAELNTNEKKAEILFYLSYFKCFNDVSLLTKNECFVMRNILKQLYKYSVSQGELNVDE